MKVTDRYCIRGFSDSGVIDDLDDKQDTDDDSQELHCVNKYYSHESPPTFGGCTDDRNQPHHRIYAQAGDQTTRNSCIISSSTSYKTAIEHSGQSNFKDAHNNGNDAPVNSNTLEPQKGCLANNAWAASNIDGLVH